MFRGGVREGTPRWHEKAKKQCYPKEPIKSKLPLHTELRLTFDYPMKTSDIREM